MHKLALWIALKLFDSILLIWDKVGGFGDLMCEDILGW